MTGRYANPRCLTRIFTIAAKTAAVVARSCLLSWHRSGRVRFSPTYTKTGLNLLLLVIAAMASSRTAHAVFIPGIGWGYSLGYGAAKVTGLNPPGYTGLTNWSIWWDPPATALIGRASFAYDSSLMTILPQHSGFVGLYSDNPLTDVPVTPTETYPEFDTATLPGPRPGMVWDLTVTSNTVSLFWDVSANPVTVPDTTGSLNFFMLAVQTSMPLSGWKVNNTSTGQFRELGSLNDQSQTYMLCSAPNRGTYNCGETTSPTRGFGLTAVQTPEPATLFLAGGALLCLGLWGRRKKLVVG